MVRWLVLLVLAAVMCLDGCTAVQSYRTQLSATPPECPPAGGVKCASEIVQVVKNPRGGRDSLLFVSEFDDQGATFESTSATDHSGDQLDIIEDGLRRLLHLARGDHQFDNAIPELGTGNRNVSVVVFVHGWTHSAQDNDGNLETFRGLLGELQAVEDAAASKCSRQVVGVFVGWRGATLSQDSFFENLSFYSRKATAERVAQGDVRLLFAKLRAVQTEANDDEGTQKQAESKQAELQNRTPDSSLRIERDLACSRPMRLVVAGHSFGGLIVHNALSPVIINDVELLHSAEQRLGKRALPRRPGDLVLLINPAVEATRFTPLQKASSNSKYFHQPMLVSITTEADEATGIAFPIGRWAGTLLERYPDTKGSQEYSANLSALGHFRPYITHCLVFNESDCVRLAGLKGDSPAPPPTLVGDLRTCDQWTTLNNAHTARPGDSPTPWLTSFKTLVDEELRLAQARNTLLGSEGIAWNAGLAPTRMYCTFKGAMALPRGPELKTANPLVWNVRTIKDVMAAHSDLGNPVMTEILRQLYIDTSLLPATDSRSGPN